MIGGQGPRPAPGGSASQNGVLNIGVLLAQNPDLQIHQDNYNINVTANFGLRMPPEEVLQWYTSHPGAGRPAHLYFHVPLCSYLCHFCNYVKRLLPRNGRGDEVLAQWTGLLIQESERHLARAPWLPEAKIESFYIGGGTASLLSEPHLSRLMEHVRQNYAQTGDCELSLEGNPDEFQEKQVVEAALHVGFNRFSLGVQSFQDEVNHFAGREHDGESSLRAIENLLGTGCPFNVDMMFGLPYQTVETVARDMGRLISLRVPTITIYRFRNADRQSLGIGNRSAWNIPSVRDHLHRTSLFPSLHETYRMREAIVGLLIGAGYWPSPCGWWSAPGTYPDGNIPRVSRNKWQRYDTMIAFGPGAYGWLTGRDSVVVQTHNQADITAYVRHMETAAPPPLASGYLLQGHQAVASALGFAFKANQPIEVERFRREYGVELLQEEPYQSVIRELTSRGFMEQSIDGKTLCPSLKGEVLHEEIISVFIHERIGGCAGPSVCRKFSPDLTLVGT